MKLSGINNCFNCLHGVFEKLNLEDYLSEKIICLNPNSDKFEKVIDQNSLCDWHESMEIEE